MSDFDNFESDLMTELNTTKAKVDIDISLSNNWTYTTPVLPTLPDVPKKEVSE